MSANRVLIIDDDTRLTEMLAEYLAPEGLSLTAFANGSTGLREAQTGEYDLIVLDVMLPGLSGFEVLRQLRESGSETPVLMLTARGDDVDRIVGLEMGADDYLAKPFSPKILVARIRALLRRVGIEGEGTATLGALTLKPDELTLQGLPQGTVRLTRLETRFLQLLMANGGRPVATERILGYVWGNRAAGNRQLLKQLVHRLRQKVEPDPGNPVVLKTLPNAGYLLDAEAVSADER